MEHLGEKELTLAVVLLLVLAEQKSGLVEMQLGGRLEHWCSKSLHEVGMILC